MSSSSGRRRRARRFVAPWVLSSLAPLYRYSASRDAYVLRLVGNRIGPVLRPGYNRKPQPAEARPSPDSREVARPLFTRGVGVRRTSN